MPDFLVKKHCIPTFLKFKPKSKNRPKIFKTFLELTKMYYLFAEIQVK
ncbi:mCG140526 [Mus musculus]|nr:mCG140526 [Mus musculus]